MSIIVKLIRSISLLVILMIAMVGIEGSIGSDVFAQNTNADAPSAGAVPGGVTSGASSDSELWRKIRQGSQGTVVGGDKSGGLMIQSGGQDYRLIRNGPLPRYTAWAILVTLILLALFFAIRGRIKVSSGLSGKTIKRFSMIERIGHWLLASSFIVLALTGLNLIFGKSLILPLIGKEAFATITVFGKFVHNYVAFAFMLGLVMIAVMWVVHNIPSMVDVKWLLRGGGIIGKGHPPAKKFNAGQKIIFWMVILCGISISLSGWALMNPFTTEMMGGTFSFINSIFGTSYQTDLSPIQEQQYQSIWHATMAAIMIAIILAHIYIGSIGMQGSLAAMTTGEVDTNWAKEHHSLWVDEVMGNREAEIKSNFSVARTPEVPQGAPAVRAKITEKGKTAKLVVVPRAEESAFDKDINVKKNLPTAEKAASTRAAVAKKPAAKKKTVTRAKPAAKSKSVKSKTVEPKRKPAKAKAKGATNRDDLKRIKGVGPQNERRLNAMGIYRFTDVAKWSKADQARIGDELAFPGRIEREEWVKQAKALSQFSS